MRTPKELAFALTHRGGLLNSIVKYLKIIDYKKLEILQWSWKKGQVFNEH